MPVSFLEVEPRSFNPVSVPGLTNEAREAVKAALKAMSSWRNEMADTSERNGKQVIEGMAKAAAVLGWLAVNLPVMIAAPSGWAYFFVFSKERGADWGSIWFMFEHFNVPVLGNPQLDAVNKLTEVFFAAACVAIAVLALTAPRRPRLPAQRCRVEQVQPGRRGDRSQPFQRCPLEQQTEAAQLVHFQPAATLLHRPDPR